MEKISTILKSDQVGPTTFAEYLDRYAERVGAVINSYIPVGELVDINRYLYDPLVRFSENGGKRHRPLICFAACEAVGGDVDLATSAAAAIEHFQTAALIHDDIADDAELRRGQPCLYLTEGVGPAINMGDLALLLVNGTVINDPTLDDGVRLKILGELVDMTRHTIEGQALDLGWARDERYDIGIDEYIEMATRKTAYYSGAVPLAIGAIIGGGTDTEIEALRKYGLDTGLAFQIQDDLLNLIGKEESTKKGYRDDITEGKRTLIVVHALSALDGKERDRLIEILQSATRDEDMLAEAVELMWESGSIDYAKEYASNLTSVAKSRLCEAISPSNSRDLLESMADWFISRLG